MVGAKLRHITSTDNSFCILRCMSKSLTVKPTGELRVEDAAAGAVVITASLAARLEAEFARSSADGLVLLAGEALAADLPPEFVYRRDFARRLFQAACQLG